MSFFNILKSKFRKKVLVGETTKDELARSVRFAKSIQKEMKIFRKLEKYDKSPIWNYFNPSISVQQEEKFRSSIGGTRDVTFFKPPLHLQHDFINSNRWINWSGLIDNYYPSRLYEARKENMFDEVFSPSIFLHDIEKTGDLFKKYPQIPFLPRQDLEDLKNDGEEIRKRMVENRSSSVQKLDQIIDNQIELFERTIMKKINEQISRNKKFDLSSFNEKLKKGGIIESKTINSPLSTLFSRRCEDLFLRIFSFMNTIDLLINISPSCSYFFSYVRKRIPLKILISHKRMDKVPLDRLLRNHQIEEFQYGDPFGVSYAKEKRFLLLQRTKIKNTERIKSFIEIHSDTLKYLSIFELERIVIEFNFKDTEKTERPKNQEGLVRAKRVFLKLKDEAIKSAHEIYDSINQCRRLESLATKVLPSDLSNLRFLRKLLYPINFKAIIYGLKVIYSPQKTQTIGNFRPGKDILALTKYFKSEERVHLRELRFIDFRFLPDYFNIFREDFAFIGRDRKFEIMTPVIKMLRLLNDSVMGSCSQLKKFYSRLFYGFEAMSLSFLEYLSEIEKVKLVYNGGEDLLEMVDLDNEEGLELNRFLYGTYENFDFHHDPLDEFTTNWGRKKVFDFVYGDGTFKDMARRDMFKYLKYKNQWVEEEEGLMNRKEWEVYFGEREKEKNARVKGRENYFAGKVESRKKSLEEYKVFLRKSKTRSHNNDDNKESEVSAEEPREISFEKPSDDDDESENILNLLSDDFFKYEVMFPFLGSKRSFLSSPCFLSLQLVCKRFNRICFSIRHPLTPREDLPYKNASITGTGKSFSGGPRIKEDEKEKISHEKILLPNEKNEVAEPIMLAEPITKVEEEEEKKEEILAPVITTPEKKEASEQGETFGHTTNGFNQMYSNEWIESEKEKERESRDMQEKRMIRMVEGFSEIMKKRCEKDNKISPDEGEDQSSRSSSKSRRKRSFWICDWLVDRVSYRNVQAERFMKRILCTVPGIGIHRIIHKDNTSRTFGEEDWQQQEGNRWTKYLDGVHNLQSFVVNGIGFDIELWPGSSSGDVYGAEVLSKRSQIVMNKFLNNPNLKQLKFSLLIKNRGSECIELMGNAIPKNEKLRLVGDYIRKNKVCSFPETVIFKPLLGNTNFVDVLEVKLMFSTFCFVTFNDLREMIYNSDHGILSFLSKFNKTSFKMKIYLDHMFDIREFKQVQSNEDVKDEEKEEEEEGEESVKREFGEDIYLFFQEVKEAFRKFCYEGKHNWEELNFCIFTRYPFYRKHEMRFKYQRKDI